MFATIVAALTCAAFLPALSAGFVNYDDDRLVLRNPYLKLAWPGRLAWIWSTTYMGHYQPLAWLSLAVDYTAAGLRPLVYHADSLAWHAAGALALYAVLLALLARVPATRGAPLLHQRLAASAATLMWSVHPLRVESVAWIAERRDTVSGVFWLLALFAYLESADTGKTALRSRRWYAASIGFLVLSLLGKAWGMTFFVTLVALDWYPLERRAWAQKIPYAAAGLVSGAVAWAAQRATPDTMVPLAQWGPGSRVLQAAYGLGFYPWKTLWPSGLALMYELPDRPPAAWTVALVLVVAAAGFLLWRARRYPALVVAAVAYAATVAPVLGFAQSGPQAVADRYAYLSSLPFSALAAGGIVMALGRVRLTRVAAALAAILVALGVLTWRQSGVWHDSLSLWAHALGAGQSGYVVHLNYGAALRASGRVDEAVDEYRQAIALRPTSGSAWYNLANGLKAQGRLDEAAPAYERAIAYSRWKVDAQVNLANLYYVRRQYAEAIQLYREATATLDGVPPEQFAPEPYLYLGMALADSGDRDGARQALEVARRHPATRARAEMELGRLGTK